ncbi:methyltransferase domain-containing protein [Phormidium tenue FACHB-886]|nr:methyltransferase domain-containing protein [Phormidium tenue FACHB-886]
MEIHISHIVATIKTKFEVEGLISKFFEIRAYNSVSSTGLLTLDSDNCILLEFAKPHEEFPEIYKSPVYRMLIIFSLYQEAAFGRALQGAIERLQYRDNIDRIVLWSTVEVERDIIQQLKKVPADIIFIDFPTSEEIYKTKSITYFIPIENSDLLYSLSVNLISERLIKRLRKMFHLVLSEISAPIYNKYYGKSKIATREAMEFESDKLNALIKQIKQEDKTQIAIDIGCGTGRHSFVLARHFEDVYAYDFSSNMIAEAIDIKREKDIRNTYFYVNDFEYEELIDESQFYGNCDLVVASFGMGSFIEDTATMLRRFYEWLKPGGYIFISFYNANSITLNVTPSWRDTALAAQVDKENHSLEVHLTPKTRFNIFCKLFDEGVEGEINKIFNIDLVTSYPMIMALLPNSLLENDFAHTSFVSADRTLASNRDGRNGYYAIVIARKPQPEPDCCINIELTLRQFEAHYEILQHEPVLSMEDVKKEIGYFPNCMIKTLILHNKKTAQFIVVLTQSEKRLDKAKVAEMFNVGAYQIRFATEKEVLKLGFPVGGIAPFGFIPDAELLKFIDEEIATQSCEWFYTGMGDNRKTLKIRKADFLRIVGDYDRIEL